MGKWLSITKATVEKKQKAKHLLGPGCLQATPGVRPVPRQVLGFLAHQDPKETMFFLSTSLKIPPKLSIPWTGLVTNTRKVVVI